MTTVPHGKHITHGLQELYKRRKHPFTAPAVYPADGPLHRYFSDLMTKDNIERLGFLDWEKCKNLVDDAFVHERAERMRKVFMVTQLIELGRLFGVKPARREFFDGGDGLLGNAQARL